jgi:hypothetical protein
VRGLASLFVFGLILVTYHFLRGLYPDDPFMRLGVPVLLATFPTDTFFYVTSDVLSPLAAGLGFFLALRIAASETSGWGTTCGLGVLLAVAFLGKYTNVALVVVAAVCTGIAWSRRPSAREPFGEGGRLLVTWAVAGVVVGAWLLRNQLVFGDPTGTAYKVERMRWTYAPLASYLDHPLFTFEGVRIFFGDLIPLFWRGEVAWHRIPLATPFADSWYLASTLLFVVLAAVGAARAADSRGRNRDGACRRAELLAFVSVGTSVALLAMLSLLYVFRATSNPSAARPYFVQGRLISGALVPFALIYVRGIQVATSRLPRRVASVAAWGILAFGVGVATFSEVALHSPIFASAYNLFHLP